jgi:hypothetical protein
MIVFSVHIAPVLGHCVCASTRKQGHARLHVEFVTAELCEKSQKFSHRPLLTSKIVALDVCKQFCITGSVTVL